MIHCRLTRSLGHSLISYARIFSANRSAGTRSSMICREDCFCIQRLMPPSMLIEVWENAICSLKLMASRLRSLCLQCHYPFMHACSVLSHTITSEKALAMSSLEHPLEFSMPIFCLLSASLGSSIIRVRRTCTAGGMVRHPSEQPGQCTSPESIICAIGIPPGGSFAVFLSVTRWSAGMFRREAEIKKMLQDPRQRCDSSQLRINNKGQDKHRRLEDQPEHTQG